MMNGTKSRTPSEEPDEGANGESHNQVETGEMSENEEGAEELRQNDQDADGAANKDKESDDENNSDEDADSGSSVAADNWQDAAASIAEGSAVEVATRNNCV